MQLLWLCLCPKMASEALSKHLISKHFLGEHAPRFPTLACLCRHTYKSDIHVTPLLKILAAGLFCTQLKHYITYSTSPNFLCVRRVRYRSIPVFKVVVGLRVTISSLHLYSKEKERGRSKTCLSPQLYKLPGNIPC